jgi:prolipoprotein diacylglyceryl transferase
VLLASFPSPDRSVWDLGPVPIRAYALCIIAGIIVAIWMGERRWVARGGARGTVSDVAVWAVIFGLIGGRLYHVVTDNELYFREGRDPWRAFYVWEGGLGIWGAVALGALGAWIACRRRGIALPPFADAVAPGIAVAQAIGRFGNYFNQELFGRPTDLPWAVEISPDRPSTIPGELTYHPTFLYEALWNVALAGVLIWLDRRFKLGRGRVFALYVMGYTLGRVWIEMLRIDTANEIFGLRVNVWTSIVVFLGALLYFLLHPGPRETDVEPDPAAKAGTADAPATPGAAAADETDADAEPDADDDDQPDADDDDQTDADDDDQTDADEKADDDPDEDSDEDATVPAVGTDGDDGTVTAATKADEPKAVKTGADEPKAAETGADEPKAAETGADEPKAADSGAESDGGTGKGATVPADPEADPDATVTTTDDAPVVTDTTAPADRGTKPTARRSRSKPRS